MNPIVKTSFRHAALALGLLGAPLALSGAQLLIPSIAHAQGAPTLSEMKQTLAAYGEFVSHAKYGEVWKPTVTPRGWHPYPACDWVFTKDYGWYFNDKTPWGAIVHHYGRWIHEAETGWLWVPGTEFSPGWVVWRTSAEWVGWAPTPPDVELTPASLEAFNDDKLWTFMDAKKFGATCEGGPSIAQYGDIYRSTTYVTNIRFVNGIGVFVLPPAIIGPIVNINIGVFGPWSVGFIGSWVWNWTNIFNDVDIDITVVNNSCTPENGRTPGGKQPTQDFPGKPLIKKIGDDAPPPPSGVGPRRPRTPNLQPSGPRRVQGPDFQPTPDRDIVVDQRAPDRIGGGRQPGRGIEPRREVETVQQQRQPRGFQERSPGRIADVEPQGRRGGGRDFDRGFTPNRGGRDFGGKDLDRGFSPNRGGPALRDRVSRFEGRSFARFSGDSQKSSRGQRDFGRFD